MSKYVDAPLTSLLSKAGCGILGENRPQVLWEKSEWFEKQQLQMPQWHMIGHLQRNKARRTIPLIQMLHALDSERLADTVSAECLKLDRKLPVLLDVNLTEDSTKTGIARDAVAGVLDHCLGLPGVVVKGLMAMSTLNATSNQARKEFSKVRELRDELQEQFTGRVDLAELSMGMSGDFSEAIAEGATMVRIGTSLWKGVM